MNMHKIQTHLRGAMNFGTFSHKPRSLEFSSHRFVCHIPYRIIRDDGILENKAGSRHVLGAKRNYRWRWNVAHVIIIIQEITHTIWAHKRQTRITYTVDLDRAAAAAVEWKKKFGRQCLTRVLHVISVCIYYYFCLRLWHRHTHAVELLMKFLALRSCRCVK